MSKEITTLIEKEKLIQKEYLKYYKNSIRDMKNHYKIKRKKINQISSLTGDYFLEEYYKLKNQSKPNFIFEELFGIIKSHYISIINLKTILVDKNDINKIDEMILIYYSFFSSDRKNE